MNDSSRSVPWSPLEIEVRMKQAILAQEDAVLTLKALAENAANLKHDYKRAEAAELLKTLDKPELKSKELREAWVYQAVGSRELAYRIAEEHVRTQREVLDSLQSEGELLRSLARSSRDLMEGPGYGGGGRG